MLKVLMAQNSHCLTWTLVHEEGSIRRNEQQSEIEVQKYVYHKLLFGIFNFFLSTSKPSYDQFKLKLIISFDVGVTGTKFW